VKWAPIQADYFDLQVTLQIGTRLKREIFTNPQIIGTQSTPNDNKNAACKSKNSLRKTGCQKQRLV
jgi:hypothetical protein